MNNAIKEQEMEVVHLGKEVTYKDISGEEITVYFEKFATTKETKNEGDTVGYVTVEYPFAGMNLKLELELTQEFSEQEGFDDYCFKIPFVEGKRGIVFIMFEVPSQEVFTSEDDYGTCECGGKLMPFHEEYPYHHMYCTGCTYDSAAAS